MDILIRMWLRDCGTGLIVCCILLAAFAAGPLVRKLCRPDWTSMSKSERKKTKKRLRQNRPEPWLIPVIIVMLCWMIADSLPYFRDMVDLQAVQAEAKIVSLDEHYARHRIKYYVCAIDYDGQKSELKLSREQAEELDSPVGKDCAFSYFPHSGAVIEIESVDK